MLISNEKEISPVTYPLEVIYCGNCTLPLEYCEYQGDYDKCKEWLKDNMPKEYAELEEVGRGEGSEEKKRQKRGGKALTKTKSSKKEKEQQKVYVSRAPRGKKKSVTVVTGLGCLGVDLKLAAKLFGTRFACGSSVTGDDEIVVQGDVKEDLLDLIPEKWSHIDESMMEDLGDMKRAS